MASNEPIPDEFFDMIDEEDALPPSAHRGAYGEDLAELMENKTETVWIDKSVSLSRFFCKKYAICAICAADFPSVLLVF